jgi:putative YphP/YqiW family bacilliredoxin
MSFSFQSGPMYDPEDVKPMSDELVAVGCRELKTPGDVDSAVKNSPGTVLIVVNSVCGCAAGGARPGVALALQNSIIPDVSTTVFAGVDREATAQARDYFTGYRPSSPSVGLLRDGKLVFMLERSDIEGHSPEEIAERLSSAFDQYCARQGPSIPADSFAALEFVQRCGSELARKAAARRD